VTSGQVVVTLLVMGTVAGLIVWWLFRAIARSAPQPADVGLSWLEAAEPWTPPRVFESWLDEAVDRYAEGRGLYAVAAGQASRDGDPALFDMYLRLATWHVQAGGLATALSRANSDRASRL
jgi:hypothetical protein